MKARLYGLGLGIAACVITFARSALCFQILPMSQTFSPSGSGSTQSYEISNSKDEPIAIEVSVVKRLVDANGEETQIPAEEDFVIYPPQVLLGPQSKQTVRVTWVGDQDPSQELSFRLVVEQLPVPLEVKKEGSLPPSRAVAAFQVMLRYANSLYIRPSHAKSDVLLQSVSMERDNAGKWLQVHIKNQGTAHQTLELPKIQLTSSNRSIILEGEVLEPINRRTILAGGERRFRIPWPTELPEGEVTGQLILQK